MGDQANNLDDEYSKFISRVREKLNDQAKNQANILGNGMEKYIIQQHVRPNGLIEFDTYIQADRFENREQAIETAVTQKVDSLNFIKGYLRARGKKLTADNVLRSLIQMIGGPGADDDLEDEAEGEGKKLKKHTRHKKSRRGRSRHRRSRRGRSRHQKRKHKKTKQRR